MQMKAPRVMNEMNVLTSITTSSSSSSLRSQTCMFFFEAGHLCKAKALDRAGAPPASLGRLTCQQWRLRVPEA